MTTSPEENNLYLMKSQVIKLISLAAVFSLAVAVSGCFAADEDSEAEADEEAIEEQLGIAFATNHEFKVREDGLETLQETYGFEFDRIYDMPTGVTHDALREGYVDVAMGFATDGKIEEHNLVSLEDDREIFPVYNPSPVVREEILAEHPEIEETLNEIAGRLDTETMIYLNYLVEIEGKPPEDVALRWLEDEDFLEETPEECPQRDPVIVGSKMFTEQLILGQITILVLQNEGITVEDNTRLGGDSATMVNRKALEMGNIHIYWEYTGTAWMTIFKEEEVIKDPEEAYRLVKERDKKKGLIWLDYAPFNNTYTIMMREEHAEQLGIETISELAEWVRQNSP